MGALPRGRFFIFIVAGALVLSMTALPARAISWGQRAPSFTLTDVSGNPTTLNNLLESHEVVVLALATTWSYQFPRWAQQLKRLANRYSDGRVAVAAVFLRDKPQKVRLFAKRHGLNNGQMLLLVDSTGSLILPYGVREIPRLLLLDGAGTIHYDGTVERIDESVTLLLNGQAVSASKSQSAFTNTSPGY